jgi:WD40 repeat protein
MDVSPRGDLIATTLRDGSTQLWDAATGEPLGVPLRGLDERPAATAFLDGGDRLLILYNNGRAFEWDPRPQAWKRHACRVAGRGLSRSEWRELFGPRTYAPVCRP